MFRTSFSYSSDSSTVNTFSIAARDVYTFLQRFLAKYDFHVAAESYGGILKRSFTRVKPIKTEIISALSVEEVDGVKYFRHIPLKSIVIANGLSEPWTQYASVMDYLCE